MRRALDFLYASALWLSALCLVAIALLVGAQVVGRIADNTLVVLGYRRYGFIILSLSEMCGFLLAASTFFGLAGTLKAGTHIRVTLALSFLDESKRRFFEMFALAFTAAGALYLTIAVGGLARDSYRFNEISVGLLPIPLWPTQAVMAFGAGLLAVALLDEFGRVVLGKRPSFRAAEDAIQLGKES